MYRRCVFAWVAVAMVMLVALAPTTSAAPDSSSSVVHTVRPGETLYSIARYYGVDMWALARANNILNTNLIYVGQRLVIPTGGASTTGSIHVVRAGETLSGIAIRYGVNVWDLAHANGIYNLNHIWVGQRLVIPGASASPTTPSQPGGSWYGQYYNNLTFTDPPCGTRYDAGIGFDWGTAAPMSGVDADAFSVRWTRTFYFSGGTYRFYTRVDDGVRVWVDNVLIIDQWHDGSLRTFSADRQLAAGNHALKVEYYDRTQVASAHFWWERVSQTLTPTPTTTATTAPAPSSVWHGVYYNNADLREPPAAEANHPSIGFEWEGGAPLPGIWPDNFSVRWTKTTYLEEGDYRFCLMLDDGGRFWVDGDLVVDEWHVTNGIAFCGIKHVTTGNHTFMVEYYEWTGEALIYAWWEEATD
ncbi:MAG: LysM peptidoglycan-binding domain-containing protein [Anaerolineae bacterium]|nr:LysM peptidoglycan-binding domain-containing protein [Anaerolineae bacterium]